MAQVPQLLNYQGRVAVGSTNFDGTGQFKFALVDAAGTTTFWSNNGTSVSGGAPTAGVSLPVSKGLYSVLLGDPALPNMTVPIPASVFAAADVRLRVWFNDGVNGFQKLAPDQRLAAVGYAMVAGGVPDGAITSAKIADGAVHSEQIANGAVGFEQINTNIVQRRIQGSAPAGFYITGVNGDGTVTSAIAAPNLWQQNATAAYYLGNVGIGTNSPAYKLHISDTGGLDMRLDGPSPAIQFVDTSASNLSTFLRGNAGGLRVVNNSSAVIMDLKANGFLGLGTTTPASPLHINGTADALRLTAVKPYITLDDTGTGSYARIQSNGAGMDFKSYGAVLNSFPGFIHLDGNGTVGLGTATPVSQLSIRYFTGVPVWTSNNWLGAIDLDNSAAIAWGANGAGQRFGMGHTNGAFSMWRTASDPGTTGSPALYDFSINDAGNVGIGTINPASKFHIVSGATSLPPRIQSSGTTSFAAGFDFYLGATGKGFVGVPDAAAGFAAGELLIFGGPSTPVSLWSNQNRVLTVATSGNVGIGTTTPTAKLDVNGAVAVNTLTIRGGADLAEPFAMSQHHAMPGAVVVIDERNPGKLRVSDRSYDKKVAGIVSGAGGIKPGISMIQEEVLESGQNVALSGRVFVKANASAGRIEPGDLLTTSDVAGEAMKATDHDRAQGAILGKAMTALGEGAGEVLVLVTLQ